MEKILLILESEEFASALAEALAPYRVCACSPEEAGDVLAQFQPDALILDLFLPGSDGFVLMADCAPLPPAVLLLSPLDSDYVRKQAAQLGVDFLIRKPCTVEYILRHLTDILLARQYPSLPDNETLTEELLRQFHIRPKERVRTALIRAILLCAADPDCLLTKDVYSKICKEYGAGTDAVDQAFRRCLRKGWEDRNRGAAGWELLFPEYGSCPSNGKFIGEAASYLRKKYPFRF